jgi:hypothetical protein
MNRRLVLAGLAATGGLLTTAFLQAAVAAADVSATGADAFTIGSFTFDPFTVGTTGADVEGFTPAGQLVAAPPLLQLAGGDPLGLDLAQQNFEVFAPSTGTDLGSINTVDTVTNLLGLTNTSFTVQDVTPAAGGSASDLPTVGSVYDAFNLGSGYENIYTAIAGTNGGADTVTDTLVTPLGNVNLDSLFGGIDAAAPLQPGDAFTGLEAGDSSIGADAFTIGGFTLDPFTGSPEFSPEGFLPVPLIAASPPLLDIGGGELLGGGLFIQQFALFSGTGSGATEVGSLQATENVTDLLGLTNTELTDISNDPNPRLDPSGAGFPTQGSVLDAFNLGNGYTNVYTDIPSTTGGADTITDTLITPMGNINLDSLFGGIDAAAPLQPGDAFTGLQAGDSSIGADAFSLGGFTFDPTMVGSTGANVEGFTPVGGLFAAPPLLDLGGGTLQLGPGDSSPDPLAQQDFNVFDGTGASATEVGSVTGNVDVTNLLGLTDTEFTVASVTPAADASASADLPTVGSVFDAFNLGGGFENVYTAIPGVTGAPDTITDTLVTPFGNLNLDSLFGGIDAAMPLDPGAAFGAGLDAATAAATEAATSAASAIDPLSFLGL